jgi:hypothetical protein
MNPYLHFASSLTFLLLLVVPSQPAPAVQSSSCAGCAKVKTDGTDAYSAESVDPNDPSCKLEVKASYKNWKETCTDTTLSTPCFQRTCRFSWTLSARVVGCSSSGLTHKRTSLVPPSSTSYPNASSWTSLITEPIGERRCNDANVNHTGIISGPSTVPAITYDLNVGCEECK